MKLTTVVCGGRYKIDFTVESSYRKSNEITYRHCKSLFWKKEIITLIFDEMYIFFAGIYFRRRVPKFFGGCVGDNAKKLHKRDIEVSINIGMLKWSDKQLDSKPLRGKE